MFNKIKQIFGSNNYNEPLVGKILRGHYKITEKLSHGGIGETFLDIDIPSQRQCVIKRILPQIKDNPDIIRLFNREAQTLEKLGDEHDQIPKLYAYFVENNDFYLVQEYIEGSDLTREIGSALYTKTPPTIRISELQNNSSANKESISRFRQQWEQNDVIKLLKEILTILEYVHQQGIIHRDIKPANLIRRKNDNKIVLIDFGCVKEVSNTIVNNQGQTVYNMRTRIGTVGYCPPE